MEKQRNHFEPHSEVEREALDISKQHGKKEKDLECSSDNQETKVKKTEKVKDLY